MPEFLGTGIQDLFFLALRLAAATGAFLAGWFLGGPVAALLGRLAFHRPLPASGRFFSKLGTGLLLGLLVFWYLVLGPGGGGGGRGGGTGAGIGPGKNGSGPAKGAESGVTGSPAGKAGPQAGAAKGTQTVIIELLGGAAVQEGRYYLLDKGPKAVDGAALKAHLEAIRHKIAGIDIIVTDESVGESHQAYRFLLQLAREFPTRIVPTGKQKLPQNSGAP